MVTTENLFDAFSKLNVLVLGDVMIDRYLNGEVNRISPEAPVPVVQLQARDSRLGGAANVALNLRALGANPFLCSVIGDDQRGEELLNILPSQGLSARGILQSKKRKTTVKTRVSASNQQLLRVDEEDTHDLSPQEQEQFLENIRDLLDHRDIHVILFQDYNKGVLPHRVINEVILEAIKRDIPTAADPKFKNFWSYKHITLFKPNLKEIRAQVEGLDEVDHTKLLHAARQIRNKLGNQYTLITLSELGLYIEDGERGQIYPTQARTIADVCGAGDTVISVASLGLALGLPLYEIAHLSNLAGGQVCERVGVVPVDKGQLRAEYEQLMGRQKPA